MQLNAKFTNLLIIISTAEYNNVRLALEAHSTYQESSFMSIYKLFEDMAQYISEAVVRIFSPNDDTYPTTGVQPFTGQKSKVKS